MARLYNRLSALAVQTLQTPGRHPDGGGLYLQITASGGKSWIFRYHHLGRERQMGLGPTQFVPLAEARQLARDARRQRYEGQDPLRSKHEQRAKQQADQRRGVTFGEAMVAYIETNKAAWRNAKHVQQWRNTLDTYTAPRLGGMRLADIETQDVLNILKPIWLTKTETASRLRGRIETVLNWGAAHGMRQGENPARWKGHLEMILPAKSKVAKVRHLPALPYRDLPAFMAAMASVEGVGVSALRFTILTAARTGEVIGADWSEIDLANRVWTIPAVRMKAGRAHRAPLSQPAMEILQRQRQAWLKIEARRHRKLLAPGQTEPVGPVFWGKLAGKTLSRAAMLMVLKRTGHGDLTTHGFRSAFRDWAAEETDFPSQVVEMALAHAIGNRVEAAYRRGDLFEKRKRLMDDWALACLGVAEPAP